MRSLKPVDMLLSAASFLVVLFLPFLICVAHGQTSKGILAGVVRDPAGAVIARTRIAVTNEQTSENRETWTNGQGQYRIDAISPGLYSLDLEASGFQRIQIKHLRVEPSVVTSFDPHLHIGRATTNLVITANENAINTQNGQLSGVVGPAELRSVPVFTLNPVELATTLPGVQIVDTKLPNYAFADGVNIQVNGARARANSFMVDGADINDVAQGGQAFSLMIPDAFASVSVLTNAFSAEYGGAGGAVVNMVTKSGTNQFHGTGWELYTGSGLNALNGQTRLVSNYNKPRYNQHQLGFSLGGPVLRNRLFAFGSAQWSRYYGKVQTGLVSLPTQQGYATLQSIGTANSALLQKLLSGGSYLKSYIPNAAAGSPGTGTVNSTDCPSSAPNCSVQFGYFYRPAPELKSPDTQWLYRLDYLASTTDTFSFRYLHDRQLVTPDIATNPYQLPGFDTNEGGPSEIGSGAWTHVFSTRLLNEFRATETRNSFLFDLTPEAKANPLTQIPAMTISAIAGLAPLGSLSRFPQGRTEDLYQLQDTVSWNKGRHSIRAGFDLAQQIEITIVPFNRYGTLAFTGTTGATSAFANFLDNYLGPSGTATRSFGVQRFDPHSMRQSYFVQDDFHPFSELTLSIGVRYEYQGNPENSLKYPALDPQNPFGILSLQSDGSVLGNGIKVKADKNNLGPRIGLAYNPQKQLPFLADGKTVYHAGYGILYDPIFSSIVVNTASSAPNIVSGSLTSTQGRGLANATDQISQISPQLKLTASVTSVVNNLVNPLTEQWNLGFERAMPADIKWALNYVGTRGEKLFLNQLYNYINPATAKRLNPSYGSILARGNFGDSIYQGLQTQLTRSFSRGVLLNATYTFSKNLDNGSEIYTTFSQPTSYAANLAPGGQSGEWGASAYDHRHYASFLYVWSISGFHAQGKIPDGLLSAITRHWTVSGTTQFQSGPYSTWNFSGIDSNGDGITNNDRPVEMNRKAAYTNVGLDGAFISGGKSGTYYDLYACNASKSCNKVVDPSQQRFLIVSGQRGNVRRNSFENPGTQYWNVALQKDVPLHWKRFESGALQFRCEAQDVGNHNNVGALDLNLEHLGTTPFLNKSSARETDGRQIRFWAKLSF